MSKRRRSTRQKQKRRMRRRNAHPNGTTLRLVDQKPFLKKAVTACRRLRTELHKKQQRLRQFEEVETDAYNRWISSHFGVELSRLRELQEEVDDLEFIVEQLRMCELCLPQKLPEVYEELFQRKEEGTLHFFVPPEMEKEDERADERETGEESDPIEDELRDAFESFFDDVFGPDEGADERGYEEYSGWQSGGMRRGKTPPLNNGPVKALYRALAKRLHPDHSDLEEDLRERRWHELQKAYRFNDIDGLQRIEAVCDMDEGGLNVSLGLVRLQDLAAYHQSHLRPIRQALRAAKRHPAFGFSGTYIDSHARVVRQDFKNVNQDFKTRLHWLEQSAREILEEATQYQNPKDGLNNEEIDEWFDIRFQSMTEPSGTKSQKTDSRQMEFF
ncbi:MAG: J domain-containing protein [Verrucomicrobia bacterium]|nr:J domain-containing protein [Verrucomicrobiota bacterium]